MHKQGTIINDTSYKFGIVQYHPGGNMEHGSLFDFDEFGFRVKNVGGNVLLPGDVPFQLEGDTEVMYATERIEMLHRKRLEVYEAAVKMLLKPESMLEYVEKLDPDSKNQLFDCAQTPLEELQRSIERKKLELIPFECRRNKVKSPFKYYIEFTITKRSRQYITLFEYTKKKFEAVKQLHEVFFGGRSEPILVQLLDLIPREWIPQSGIYRLPIDCRLHANQVNALDDDLAHPSFPLLVANSENLDTLWVRYHSDSDTSLRNQIVQSAKKLVIAPYTMTGMEGVIQNLPNLDISMVATCRQSFPMHYDALMNAWLRGNRPAGASFWIEVENDKTASKVLRLVKRRYKNAERIWRFVTIPRDDSTKVNIFYAPIEESPLSSYDNIYKWTLKVEIVNV